MQKITPFLWFEKKNAEEAIDFYCSIFKNSKIISIKRYPEGVTEGPMKGMDGKIMTAVFELEGQTFMAIDGGPYFKPTGAISFLIDCVGQEEVDYYWDKLTEGTDEKKQECGWLEDKYGFYWQVVPRELETLLDDPDKEVADYAMEAMMKMKKIIIGDLKKN